MFQWWWKMCTMFKSILKVKVTQSFSQVLTNKYLTSIFSLSYLVWASGSYINTNSSAKVRSFLIISDEGILYLCFFLYYFYWFEVGWEKVMSRISMHHHALLINNNVGCFFLLNFNLYCCLFVWIFDNIIEKYLRFETKFLVNLIWGIAKSGLHWASHNF